MTFSSLYLLTAIIAALFSTYPRTLYRLRIDYPGAGLRVSLEAHPYSIAQGCVHPLPRSVQAELSEVMIDAAPRREIVGKQAPGAAAPHDIEDGVKDLAQRIETRTSIGFGNGKIGLQAGPLGIGEVG